MLVDQPNSFLRMSNERLALSRREPGGRLGRKKRSHVIFLEAVRTTLHELPGWWLAALLVLAPFAYGTTFPQTKDWLAAALCGLGVVFLISLLFGRRWPRVNWLSALLSVVLLAQGWLMTWNAKLIYDPRVFYFHPVSSPVPWLPGTVDQAVSWHQMALITGLFCAFWVASDFAASGRWRKRLWLIMSLTGVGLMVLGLLQRVTEAPGIFWRSDLDCGPTFFATYRYHANAGSFINIILPLIVAQCICAFRKNLSGLAKAFWLLASICVLVSAFINVSRAATTITVCSIGILSANQLLEILRTHRHLGKRQLTSVVIGVVAATGALIWVIGFGEAYKHWAELGKSIVADGRFSAYTTIEHHVLPRVGWCGFGAATFALIFPFFTNGVGTAIQGYWEYAHEDYLECLVEWGILGAVVWLAFFGNTIVRAVWTFLRRKRAWDARTRMIAVACFLALGSVLVHSTVDFPMQIASLQLYTSVILGFLASMEFSNAHRSRRFKVIAENAEEEEKG